MKLIISSSELLAHLQVISKAISSKSTMPSLDCFLFDLKGPNLTITASDMEVTMSTTLKVDNNLRDGKVALSSRMLLEVLKKLPDQPLTIDVSLESLAADIVSDKGKYSFVGISGEDFPEVPVLDSNVAFSVQVPTQLLFTGISKTLFATADDDLRPVMNGILLEISPTGFTFVASDAHKLVKYQRFDVNGNSDASFILPKKPANLLKGVLPRETGDVAIEFDQKNAVFTLPNYKLVCRLVEGNYPAYNAVIPQDNPYKAIIDRVDLANAIGRVSIFSNQATQLVKLHLSNDEIMVSAQDIDFSHSGFEKVKCQYEGDEMEIGFKSAFFHDILENVSSGDIVIEMSNPSRAALILPFDKNSNEDELMLIMPMMINS